jgi:hypothetical protein
MSNMTGSISGVGTAFSFHLGGGGLPLYFQSFELRLLITSLATSKLLMDVSGINEDIWYKSFMTGKINIGT